MKRYLNIVALSVLCIALAMCADRRGQQIKELEAAKVTVARNHALDLAAVERTALQDAGRLAARAEGCKADSVQAYDLGFGLGSARCGLEP